MTRTLIGPDRLPHLTQTDVRDPGTYRMTWSGRTPTGTEPEGRWRWVVDALDDTGQHSRVERRFYLNRTLGYLRVRPSRVVVRRRRGASLRVRFRLAHPATVTVTMRNARGTQVRTIRRRLGTGWKTLHWDGRYGNGVRAASGRYTAQVQTSNAFGPAELERRFFVRRARR